MTQGKIVSVRLNATELAKMYKLRGDESISIGRFIKRSAMHTSPKKVQIMRLKEKVDNLEKLLDTRNVEILRIKDKLNSALGIIEAGE